MFLETFAICYVFEFDASELPSLLEYQSLQLGWQGFHKVTFHRENRLTCYFTYFAVLLLPLPHLQTMDSSHARSA